MNYREVRENAIGIYNALDNATSQCRCSVPHNANLRLESRLPALETVEDSVSNQSESSGLRFRIMFQSGDPSSESTEHWQELHIIPVESPILPQDETNPPLVYSSQKVVFQN